MVKSAEKPYEAQTQFLDWNILKDAETSNDVG
jgi:hypothetical protein